MSQLSWTERDKLIRWHLLIDLDHFCIISSYSRLFLGQFRSAINLRHVIPQCDSPHIDMLRNVPCNMTSFIYNLFSIMSFQTCMTFCSYCAFPMNRDDQAPKMTIKQHNVTINTNPDLCTIVF